MVASINPPYAVPEGDGPTGATLKVDGTPRVYAPAATPSGSGTEVDEVATGFTPEAVPDGSSSLIFAGFTRLGLTSYGADGDVWTVSFRGTDATYTAQPGDDTTAVAVGLALVVDAAFPNVLSEFTIGPVLFLQILDLTPGEPAPTVSSSGAGTHTSDPAGLFLFTPAAIPSGGAGEVDEVATGYTPLPTPGGFSV